MAHDGKTKMKSQGPNKQKCLNKRFEKRNNVEKSDHLRCRTPKGVKYEVFY